MGWPFPWGQPMVDITTQEKMEEAIIQKVREMISHGWGKLTVCVQNHAIAGMEEFRTFKPDEVTDNRS